MTWQRQMAECELVYGLGSSYPIAVRCKVYEEDGFPNYQKRFVESKEFKLEKIIK